MSRKNLTNEELLAQFDDLGGEDKASGATPRAKPSSKKSAKKAPAARDQESENDPLAELADLATRPPSRPNTPKVSSSAATSRTRSPKRSGVATPPSTGSTRSSEDRPHVPNATRKSGESARSFHQGVTPSVETEEKVLVAPPTAEPLKQQSGGRWWGGIFATASAAVKQAEAAVKEIQNNEEAQRWAEQVKGNVGALRGLGTVYWLEDANIAVLMVTGGDLRSRALPTFTNILNTIAPPISQHERLQIHITHDLVNYPSLDPIIYQTFSRVMSQVEGGDLMVIQRGSESSLRRGSDVGYRGSGSSGWNDGPWWRQNETRSLNAVSGIAEATKLARASAESYANEFFAAKGGVEEAAKQATQNISESNPVRKSDIFLALQAVSHSSDANLFGKNAEEKKEGGIQEPPEDEDKLISFAIYLHDPVHTITFKTLTQAFPQKWMDWLEAVITDNEESLPTEIREIVETGGVDPREWVAEWVEEAISLGIGVVAQRYVARRMGVGEGGIGRGKSREHVIESGGGEAARAL